MLNFGRWRYRAARSLRLPIEAHIGIRSLDTDVTDALDLVLSRPRPYKVPDRRKGWIGQLGLHWVIQMYATHPGIIVLGVETRFTQGFV